MKHLRIILFTLILVIGFVHTHAQDEDSPWAVGVGFNVIDFYPVNTSDLKNAGVGGSWYDEFFNANDHYNMNTFVSRISVSRYIKNSFSFELAASINRIKKLGKLYVDDLSFFSIDASLKYSASNILKNKNIDPYVIFGGGYSWYDSEGLLTGNLGLGVSYWFNDKFGLNAQSFYKHSFDFEIMYSHFQHSAGVVFKFGSKDTDSDGILDKDDNCPELFGSKEHKGCPDTDADGVVDTEDNCINEAGPIENNGCPFPDLDGDGILDKDDDCPNEFGSIKHRGCPDTDGDGLVDSIDNCIHEAGPIQNLGCPFPDMDGDGVPDKDDECPEVPGPISNKGCEPLPEIVKSSLDSYLSTIEFENNKATIKEQGQGPNILEIIAGIILKYPNNKIVVEGHTDHKGSIKLNQKLSVRRAEEVKKYLVKYGVDESLITVVGYGKSRLLYEGTSKEVNEANRRVEIKFLDD